MGREKVNKPFRITELDALRGICIIFMVAVHLLFDLDYIGGVNTADMHIFNLLSEYGGIIFVLISGIAVTLGKRYIKRGLQVLGVACGVTTVTVAMYLLNFSGKSMIIYFGVLHLLGVAMLSWEIFKRFNTFWLAVTGIVFTVTGYIISDITVQSKFLFPLGLTHATFSTSDYFPILPNLGWFLIGAVIGRIVYNKKQGVIVKSNSKVNSNVIYRFLVLTGKNSLWIYVIHQPVLFGIVSLIYA